MILTKITTLEFSVLTSVEASPELSLTSEFNEVAEGDLGKMRAEHFSVKFLLCLPTTERRRVQRGKNFCRKFAEFVRTRLFRFFINPRFIIRICFSIYFHNAGCFIRMNFLNFRLNFFPIFFSCFQQ